MFRGRVFSSILLVAGVLLTGFATRTANAQEDAWKKNWQVEEGFSIEIDTEGYDFPSAIAFVPNPGDDPKDPLYFVTELRGKVKVVTNDRSVYTFAEDFFELTPPEELPSIEGEMGMAAIELDPEHGYVFVSFVYQDEEGILRNNIARFDTEPGTFSLEPRRTTFFTDVFDDYFSRVAHQIGPMVVEGNTLYVSVGDAGRPFDSQDLNSVNGKILRMTLDGRPVPSNPFYVDGNIDRARNYVWAYGFRNPFGLASVNDRLFVAGNGLDVDRFVEVAPGENYGWDGSDWSIGANAQLVFGPAVAPMQLAWLDQENTLFPEEYRSKFYLVLAGGESGGSSKSGAKSVVTFEYDMGRSKLLDRPHHFLRYRGAKIQLPVGAQFGPDGMYVVPLYPLQNGKGVVLKVTHSPEKAHPYVVDRFEKAKSLMVEKGCYSCHGARAADVRPGPPLNETLVPRLVERLSSEEYIESVREIDQLDAEPYRSFQEERDTVLEAEGVKQARLWIKYRLMKPTFDRRTSAMPDLQLTEAEAEAIADYLVAQSATPGALQAEAADPVKEMMRKAVNMIEGWSPYPQYSRLFAASVLGAVGGGAGTLVMVFLVLWARKRFRRSS